MPVADSNTTVNQLDRPVVRSNCDQRVQAMHVRLRRPGCRVNSLRGPERGILLITHYQRLLNYIIPDHVHVMVQGRVELSGDKELALQLEEKGYDWVKEDTREPVLT